MNAGPDLDEDTYQSVVALCKVGDALADEEKFIEAIEKYTRAWSLLPEPKTDWGASTWILAAVADAAFLSDQLQLARDSLATAMTCPDGIGNPFLHLRYGQTLFELGVLDEAADELMRAYMGGGAEVFSAEDPRYLAFLSSRARLAVH